MLLGRLVHTAVWWSPSLTVGWKLLTTWISLWGCSRVFKTWQLAFSREDDPREDVKGEERVTKMEVTMLLNNFILEVIFHILLVP